MSMKGRLTSQFLIRAFVLFAALGMVFVAWLVGFSVYTTTHASQAWVTGSSPVTLLTTIENGTTVLPSGEVTVAPTALADVELYGGWLQVLDAQGREIYAFEKPSEVPTAYAPGQLVYVRQKPSSIGQGSVFTWYSTDMGHITWVLGSRAAWQTPLQRTIPDEPVTILQAVGIFVVLSTIVALAVSWVSGGTLAKPLVHSMNWIEGLARGEYFEPRDRSGRPASKTLDGVGLRRPYRTYAEVIESLDALTGELGRTQAERERLERAREEWLTGISHDLRTPLSSVRGYADLLASEYDFSAEEVREHALVIAEKSAAMQALIDDLGLTFRLRADALPLDLERTDLVELARDAVVSLANDPRAAGRELVFEGPTGEATGGLPVDVDRGYFSRALANLLVNAVTHNPEGTTVRVGVHSIEGWMCVEISDDGVGMDSGTASRLFDRYYRGGASGSDAAGTGLGMAIARQLIEAHGGHVQVATTPGAGTTVRVCIQPAGAAPAAG